MAAVCFKRGALGQWGRTLYVSTRAARKACHVEWGVPATLASIAVARDDDDDDDGPLGVARTESGGFVLKGWGRNVRTTTKGNEDEKTRVAVPILWTPQIKALWAPVRLGPFFGSRKTEPQRTTDDALRLHRLRVSGTSLSLRRFVFSSDDGAARAGESRRRPDASPPPSRLPLGFAIAVDGLRIEIAPSRELL